MIKGWCSGTETQPNIISSPSQANGENVYYFDLIYGTMAKGYYTVDGIEYYFNTATGILEGATGITGLDGYTGWKSLAGCEYWFEDGQRQGYSKDASYRGKEIYDPTSNAWYWLDNVNVGKKAVSKDVYQESGAGEWGDIDNGNGTRIGKWVRYDADGHMIKGWQYTDEGTYYFDPTYGTMAKGTVVIDGKTYTFDTTTGTLKH
jgi:glucan-binding YG repeat protein